ncbi:MAG: DUF4105 domain-containing protein [Gammaproteobacteria bacterium]
MYFCCSNKNHYKLIPKIGVIPKVVSLVIIALFSFSFQNAFADSNEKSIQLFIDKAVAVKLHDQSSWYDLMHYRTNTFSSGLTSQADSSNYFFANDGKTNPKAELSATIRSMFNPVPISNSNEHPQCLFIARRNWLIEQFPSLEDALPRVVCTEYQSWINSIQPNSITLSFPSAYINNPGSMFGHTLLRVDPPKVKGKSNLTSYAITYAANTDERNGLLFAVKGLVGGYPGLFDILPYYDKVNEYNDLENRDIWEYELNLTPNESIRLLEHMWELRQIIFDYYFLDENCSYQLLALLDVARPGLNLANKFPVEVIPADTVRVIQEKNLIKNTYYRPSLLTNLKYQLENYTGQNLDLILGLVHDKNLTTDSQLMLLPEKEKIYTLELAYTLLQYLYKSNEISRPDYAKRSLALLKARNKLNPDINLPDAPRPAIRPEQGHKSSKMIYSIGQKSNVNFIELNWRPAYHDLLDNNNGYVDGLQINFLDISARYYENQNKVTLQKFDFVNIYSIKPRTQFFKPMSWKINTGFRRLPVKGDKNTLVYTLNGGGGISYQLFDSLRVYGLIEVTAMVHSNLKNYTSFAVGPNLGLLWQVTQEWKIWLDTTTQFYDSHNNLTYQRYELAQSYLITKNQAIRLHWFSEGVKGDLQNEIKLSLNWYY